MVCVDFINFTLHRRSLFSRNVYVEAAKLFYSFVLRDYVDSGIFENSSRID